jgi:hypothetical protein
MPMVSQNAFNGRSNGYLLGNRYLSYSNIGEVFYE